MTHQSDTNGNTQTSNAQPFYGFITAAVVLAICGFCLMGSCSNRKTEAGYVGYITQDHVFVKTQFAGMQQGPTSTGVSLMKHVINVSVTPYTTDFYFTKKWDNNGHLTDDQELVSKDRLKVGLKVHVKWHIGNCLGGQSQADCYKDVQNYVELYSVIDNPNDLDHVDPDKMAFASFANFLTPAISSYTRQASEAFDGLDLPNKMSAIGTSVTDSAKTFVKGTPFYVDTVTVGAIEPPKDVLDAIAKVQAASQKIPQLDSEIEVEKELKKQKVVEAKGIAKSMEELRDRGALRQGYINYFAIETFGKEIGAKNHEVTFLPQSKMDIQANVPVK